MSPNEFVRDIQRKAVTVKLNNGLVYTGRLASMDGNINIVLEDVKELSHGTEKTYQDAFIRGNNILYISMSSS